MYIHREYLNLQTIAAMIADLSNALTRGDVPDKQKIPVAQEITSLVDRCEKTFGVESAMESMLLAGVDGKAIFAAREIEDEYRRRFGEEGD